MKLLISNFHDISGEFADNIAVKENDRSILYSELNQQILLLSRWLRDQGLNKGDRVGIHLNNSIEYICLYYACWQKNLVPVALNTYASSTELDRWIENSGCRLIFSNAKNDELANVSIYSIVFDLDSIVVDGESISTKDQSDLRTVDVGDNDVATIIYTSGTTGNPKGITLTHKNLMSNVQSIIKSLSISSSDSFLCVLPFFYSFGNSVLHTHLACGATLVLQNSVVYPVQILQAIERNKCTGFAGVPSLYITLLKKTDFSKHDLSTLRYMTQAGGPLSREFIEQVRQRLPQVEFVVMYGQTEASARITFLPPDLLDSKTGSVGIGIEGVTVSIVNEQGEICGANEKGEICVQGDNVMQGYWNNPSATEKVLKHGKLMTGDMGYKDRDGFLYIVGRQTEILKISDHRVSPYEIEETLLLHPDVEECAVIGCSHEKMGQFAKAFIVKNGNNLSHNQLKHFCKQHLAHYKVPREIEYIDALPKTTSGKIKRSQLTC